MTRCAAKIGWVCFIKLRKLIWNVGVISIISVASKLDTLTTLVLKEIALKVIVKGLNIFTIAWKILCRVSIHVIMSLGSSRVNTHAIIYLERADLAFMLIIHCVFYVLNIIKRVSNGYKESNNDKVGVIFKFVYLIDMKISFRMSFKWGLASTSSHFWLVLSLARVCFMRSQGIGNF